MAFSDWKWIIGVVMAAVASIISNFGVNLQKLSHQKEGEFNEDRNYWTDRTWVIGLVMVILGSVFDFLALGFAAQSIVAPLGSLTLVANVFFAPLMLGEKLDQRDWIGTAAIVLGSALAVGFATHDEAPLTMEQMFATFATLPVVAFGLISLIVCLFTFAAIRRLEVLQNDHSAKQVYEKMRKYHRFLYGALSGIIGAQSVLFGKCTALMFVSTVGGQDLLFVHWQAYIIMCSMVASILLQIKWLNDGLMRFDSVSLIPIFQSFWILVSVMGGIVFFGESSQFSAIQAIMFPLGVFVTIAGVYVLSRRSLEPRRDSGAEDFGPDADTVAIAERVAAALNSNGGADDASTSSSTSSSASSSGSGSKGGKSSSTSNSISLHIGGRGTKTPPEYLPIHDHEDDAASSTTPKAQISLQKPAVSSSASGATSPKNILGGASSPASAASMLVGSLSTSLNERGDRGSISYSRMSLDDDLA